jgi:hypothetical protein
MEQPVRLSVLLYQEGEFWLAQCLEYDVVAQERSIPKVVEALQWTFYAQILFDEREGQPPFSTVEKAPQKFWDLFETAIPLGRTYPTLPTVMSPGSAVESVQEEFRLAA